MILTATNQTAELVLTELENTASSYNFSYRDYDVNGKVTAITPGHGVTAGTTPVAMFIGPATGRTWLV